MNQTHNTVSILIESAGGSNSDIVKLAELVSMATVVDWSLLRRMRLAFVPDFEPGVESDLWASPLVKSRGPEGFVLLPDVACKLQHDLAKVDVFKKQHRLDKVWAIMEEEHEYLPPILFLEEKLKYMGLSIRYSDKDLDNELGIVAKTFDNPKRRSLAIWVRRALKSLPLRVQAQDSAQFLRGDSLGDKNKNNELGVIPFLIRLGHGVVEFVPESIDVSSNGGKSEVLNIPQTIPLFIDLEWTTRGERESSRLILYENEPSRLRVGSELYLHLSDGSRFAVNSSEGQVYSEHIENSDADGEAFKLEEKEGSVYSLGITEEGNPIFTPVEDPYNYLVERVKKYETLMRSDSNR